MPGFGNRDAEWISPLSRYDFPQIIASNRFHCVIYGVTVGYDNNYATGIAPGTILAKNTSTGFWQTYKSGAATANGLGTAVAILLDYALPVSGGSIACAALFKGEAWFNAISGGTYDANALANLGGRVVTDAQGGSIFLF